MPSGKQITWAIVVIALVLAAAFLGVKYPLPPQPEEQPAAAAYQVPCHTEMGGVGYTCDSGGEFAVNSGASLNVAAASTATFAGVTTFTGAVTVDDIDVQGDITTSSVTIPDNVTITDTLTISGTLRSAGLITANGGVAVAGPTAAATATPALRINNLGVANDILVLAKNGTPVVKVSNAGAITSGGTAVALQGGAFDGSSVKVAGTPVVVQVGALAAGNAMICGSTTITGTGTLPTGLATPQYVQLSLAQDVTGDCARLSYTAAVATVTAKCWNAAATPAAAATAAVVNWCAVGKP